MEEDRSHVTEKIWSLTLEIIFLLAGENMTSSDHVTITVSPPTSMAPERRTMQKILEVTNMITELLTGEGGAMTELNSSIKEEIKEETEQPPVMESTRDHREETKMEDSTQEVTPHHYQRLEFKELVKEESAHTDWETPEGPALDCDWAGAKNMDVWSDEHCKMEYSPPVLSAGGISIQENIKEQAAISSDDEKEDLAAEFRGPLSAPNTNPAHLSSNTSTHTEGPSVFPHTPKSYLCLECGKSFPCISELIRHKRVHTAEKPHSCSEGGKLFSSKSSLNSHKTSHTGKKPLSPKSELMRHEIYTTEKPYPSEYSKCSWKEEPKKKIIPPGEKSHSCSECGKCFARKSNLAIHERLHRGEKPYSCSECGKCFTDKSNLLKHDRIHTGERPFFCYICGKCFSFQSSLNKHKAIHLGQGQCSRSECEKSIAQETHFNKSDSSRMVEVDVNSANAVP